MDRVRPSFCQPSKIVLSLFPDLFLDFPPLCLSLASTRLCLIFSGSRFLEMDSNGPDGVAARGLLHLQGAAGVGVNAPGPTGDVPAPQPPPAVPNDGTQPEPVEPAVATGALSDKQISARAIRPGCADSACDIKHWQGSASSKPSLADLRAEIFRRDSTAKPQSLGCHQRCE